MTKHKQNMQHRVHMGKGIGLGHGGNTKLPPLQEFELDPAFALGMEPGTRAFRLGQCSVFTSPPGGDSRLAFNHFPSEAIPNMLAGEIQTFKRG